MLTIGVDVGGTGVRAGLVDAAGAVLDTRRVATPAEEGALEDSVVDLVTELTSGCRVDAVGLAVAGFVSADRRQVAFSPHLPWRDAAVADRIEQRLAVPVVLEHDANAAAHAEYRVGAAAGARVALVLMLGTGIGGALLLDGELFRGAHGVAPELGHLPLVVRGRTCSCGKRGCWERYCSGTALGATARELLAAQREHDGPLCRATGADGRGLSGRGVAQAALEGDAVALRAVAELARWLGTGLALVADVYDPDVVVIGGAVAQSAALFLDAAREHYATSVTGSGHRPLARVDLTRLGGEAGVVGAGLLAHAAVR